MILYTIHDIGRGRGDKMNIKIEKEFTRRFTGTLVYYLIPTVIMTIAGILFTNIPQIAIPYILKYTGIENLISGDLFRGIFLNNIRTSFIILLVMIVYGEKNFRIIPKAYPVYMGILTGIALSAVAIKINMLYAIMLVLPHGIIEIPVMCFVLNGGYFFYREGDNNRNKLKIFAIISVGIISALLLAAYIEVYITRDIASFFL